VSGPGPAELREDAALLLDALRRRGLMVATAESCTGGMTAAILTDVPRASTAFERGFVTYSNAAKAEMLGVDLNLIERCGAVSEEVALAMASGALSRSRANIAVAVTGVAGPDGGTREKPVGLVHVAGARDGRAAIHRRELFGELDRDTIRRLSVRAAFETLRALL
jgi:nicotinamide-nucleotide amidase